MDDNLKNIVALWRQRLATVRAMYDGSVQIGLHVADARAVLSKYCPDNFQSLRDELAQRTPTQVLVFADELDQLLFHIDQSEQSEQAVG